jgi:D-sedoheptulose 7-phosphate isomerase
MKEDIISLFKRSIELKTMCIEEGFGSIIRMADATVESILKGGKLLICGNGGSAADAQHLAAELVVRLRPKYNRRGLPAIALAMDTSTITACGNDYSYEMLYSRVIESIGNSDDCLLGITTSGNSLNIINAMNMAKKMNIRTFGFLGAGGGKVLELCDEVFMVPGDETGRVQECHITAGHGLMEYIENKLLNLNYISLQK